MSKEEINKYLTEAMGECWHEYKSGECTCIKCGMFPESGTTALVGTPENSVKHHILKRPNFFTWQGFGKLWEWATKQKWWKKFEQLKFEYLTVDCKYCGRGNIKLTLINPTNFANAIYEFLQGEG